MEENEARLPGARLILFTAYGALRYGRPRICGIFRVNFPRVMPGKLLNTAQTLLNATSSANSEGSRRLERPALRLLARQAPRTKLECLDFRRAGIWWRKSALNLDGDCTRLSMQLTEKAAGRILQWVFIRGIYGLALMLTN